MVHNCMVCRLSSKHNKDLSFHKFPKNEEKRLLWANALGVSQITDWQYVCGNHFSYNSYAFSNARKILKPNAIPFTNEIKFTHNQKDHSNNNISSKTENIHFEHSYCMPLSPVVCISKPETSELVNEKTNYIDLQNCFIPIESYIFVENCVNTPCLPTACTSTIKTSNIVFENSSNTPSSTTKQKRKELYNDNIGDNILTSKMYPEKKRIFNSSRFGDLSLSDFETPTQISRNFKLIKTTINQLRIKNKNLYRKNKRLQTKISTLTDIVAVLKKKSLLTEIAADKLKDLDSNVLKNLVQNVLAGKKETYTTEVKQFSETLHYYSPKAYCYVRKNFDKLLPHPRTLRRLRNVLKN